MGLMRRIVNSLKPANEKPPRLGQLLEQRSEDSWRNYPADGLTPAALAAILKSVDSGFPGDAMELYEQMEETDAHLYSVANTRRLAVTGLDWQIVSAAELSADVDRPLADEAAAFARETLTGIDNFDEVIQHLSLAIGRNIAMAELVWDTIGRAHRLVDLLPVDFTRIAFGEFDEPRILTRDEQIDGIALPPGKFIVNTPHSVSGHPTRGGLLRVTALAYLGKHYAVKDWLVFAEIFGMPVRIARYDPSATPEEKRELMDMLRSLGTDAAAIFSKAVELELLEANRGTPAPPYESLCNFMNREMSKAWLGQTLTTETVGAAGSLAVAKVHDEVRQDLREDDLRKESRTIVRDLIRPIVQLKFGQNVPVPVFKRKLERPRDLRELTEILAIAVNELGVHVPTRWAHETLGIPQAEQGTEVLTPTG